MIPALNFGAIFFVFFKIAELDSFTALYIGALDVKIEIEPQESSAGNWDNLRVSTLEGALRSRIFCHPISNTRFAEDFSTRMALPWFTSNHTANKTLKAVIG